jgi:hypothetical protein
MALRSFAQLDDFRQPLAAMAMFHPLNAIPLSAIAIMLLTMGSLVGALAMLLLDVAVVVMLLKWPPVRAKLCRRNHLRARRRAAEQLASQEQAEWRFVESLAHRTYRFNPRRRDLDDLLDTFLNVALTLTSARECAECAPDAVPHRCAPHVAPLVEKRELTARRTSRAIETLRNQLETTEQLIRLSCEVAIAEHCEAGVDLRLEDAPESAASAAQQLTS